MARERIIQADAKAIRIRLGRLAVAVCAWEGMIAPI